MSETRLYTVDRDGDVVEYECFKNAHGGAMSIWRALATRYLGTSGMDFMMLMMDGMRPLFQAAKDGKLEPWEVVTLMTTYDRVVVPIEHVASVASALDKFGEQYGPSFRANFHVPEQAEALKRVADEAEEKGWKGVCWNQMSVSEALWDGVLDEGEDEPRPYNVNKDSNGHWFWPETKSDEKDAEAIKE